MVFVHLSVFFAEATAFSTIAEPTVGMQDLAMDTPLEFQTPIIVESIPPEWLSQPMTPVSSQASGISGMRIHDSASPSQGLTPPREKRSRRDRSSTPCSSRVQDNRNTVQAQVPSTSHQPPAQVPSTSRQPHPQVPSTGRQLPSLRIRIENVQGDGNCFFRAIAYILRGWDCDFAHGLLRTLAMDEWLGMHFVGYPVADYLDLDSNLGHHNLQSYTVLHVDLLLNFYSCNSRLLKDN